MSALLSEQINATGMTDKRSDQAQTVFFTVDDQIVISMAIHPADTESSESLKLFTYLGSLPENNRESVLLSLLEADFAKNLTGGATLSIEPRSKAVVLMHELGAEGLTLTYAQSALEAFTKAALHWKAALASVENKDSAPPISFAQGKLEIDIGSFI